MSWTRLDDRWTDLPEIAALPFEVRWHYLAMIQFCSRTGRFDGVLKLTDARRCSDVEDPADAVAQLQTAGLLAPAGERMLKVVRIDEHIPPPSVREHSARTKVRMQRHRKHKNGDHSECLAGNCDQVQIDTVTGEVTDAVTRNPRTGQDRTGQDNSGSGIPLSDEDWGVVAAPGSRGSESPAVTRPGECPGCGDAVCEGDCRGLAA